MLIQWLPFASHLNFLDPQTTKDGDPYGPAHFKELMSECYVICKNLNTSYADVLKMSPIERRYFIKFLVDDAKRQEQRLQEIKMQREQNK